MRRSLRLVFACVVAVAVGIPTTMPVQAASSVNIRITKNTEFDAEHGVIKGKGTESDPFVISGKDIQNLEISDTDRWVRIERNNIAGRLLLNWVGDRVQVWRNTVGNLVVNQNVKRTGMPTSGRIERNRFGIVGQLRHFDGSFQHNTIGAKDKLAVRSVNFDGFNGARFAHNTIYGFMDARLHGHHHSSGFGEGSHMHAHHAHGVDHSQRYHQVWIEKNVIRAEAAYALAYLDTGHAGNDRTATSETEPALNEPHAHHTRVKILGNKLIGSGLLINVFNAQDKQKHTRTYRGDVDIAWNTISLRRDNFFSGLQLHGIEVRNAVDVGLRITRNRISGKQESGLLSFLERNDKQAGIFLHDIDQGRLAIHSNSVSNRVYGVHGLRFTITTFWDIDDLRTKGVKKAVQADEVPNRYT